MSHRFVPPPHPSSPNPPLPPNKKRPTGPRGLQLDISPVENFSKCRKHFFGHDAGACPGRADGRGKFLQVSEALFRPKAGTTRAMPAHAPGTPTDVGNFTNMPQLFFGQTRARRALPARPLFYGQTTRAPQSHAPARRRTWEILLTCRKLFLAQTRARRWRLPRYIRRTWEMLLTCRKIFFG